MSQFLLLIGPTLGERSSPKQDFQRYAPGRQEGRQEGKVVLHPALLLGRPGTATASLCCFLQTLRKLSIVLHLKCIPLNE